MARGEDSVINHFLKVFTIEADIGRLEVKLGYQQLQLEKLDVKGIGKIKAEIKKLEGELLKKKREILDIEMLVLEVAKVLPPVQAAIVKWRYICRFKWSLIAKKSGYSTAQLMREHNKALKDISFKDESCVER